MIIFFYKYRVIWCILKRRLSQELKLILVFDLDYAFVFRRCSSTLFDLAIKHRLAWCFTYRRAHTYSSWRCAQVNIFVGFVFLVWIAGPLVFYLNLWDARNLPIRSTNILTPNGSFYPYTEVDDHGYRLNESVYLEYNEKHGSIRVSAMHIINLACHFLFIHFSIMENGYGNKLILHLQI